jgi:hypothetical protein
MKKKTKKNNNSVPVGVPVKLFPNSDTYKVKILSENKKKSAICEKI